MVDFRCVRILMLPASRHITRLLNTGITAGLTDAEVRRTRLLNKISLAIAVTLLIYVPVELAFGLPLSFVLYTGLSSIIGLICIYLNHQRMYRIAVYSFLLFCIVSTSASALMLGINGNARYILISGAVLPLVFLRSTWHSLVWVIASYLAYCAVSYMQSFVRPVIVIEENLMSISNYTMIFTTFLLIFLLTLYFKQDNTEYETRLHLQNIKIESKNREITDSITYAKRLQEAILPPMKQVQHHLPRSFILYRPKDIVAGDFYWMEERNGKILFAVGDCTGHGVPGALVSMVCSNALNRAVKEFGITEPGQVLDKVTGLVVETFSKSESEVRDGMDISLCCIDKASRSLRWAGANNPLWIVRNGEMIMLRPDKQPVGKYEHRKPFTTHTLQLEENDRIYIFSDGFADQFGGPKGKKFKYSQLKDTLLASRDLSLEAQEQLLNNTLHEWKGSLEQVDDVCIMCVEV